VRIVEPGPHSSPIPPVSRGMGGPGPSFKDGSGFFPYFQEADQASCIPQAISRRQERQRMEVENGLYPSFMSGVEIGPHH
jgi:hypothetical protein